MKISISPKDNHPIFRLLQRCKTLSSFKKFHAQMITNGLIFHTYPISRVLLVSCVLSPLSYTLSIFDSVKDPTIFIHNTLISSLAEKGRPEIVLSLYENVLAKPNLGPNEYTYPSLFKALGAHQWFRHGQILHAHVLKFLGIPQDRFILASLLNFYAKCGKVGTARCVFDQIRAPDLASWNSMLSSYARDSSVSLLDGFNCLNSDGNSHTSSSEVLNLFRRMQKSAGLQPNEVTLVAVITACSDMGALSQGVWAHNFAIRNNLSLNCFVVTALITLYANLGWLKFSQEVFDQMKYKDKFCFNAMIRALAIHGHGNEALTLFKSMMKEGFFPDDFTILAVMTACSHIGLVDEGCYYFETMGSKYGLEPKLEHYSCLLDLLGRAGLVEEAHNRVLAMPMKPNAVIWRSLLGAARIHGNIEIGERSLIELLELEPETSGNYVLLSNIYACMDRWDDVKRVRKLMKNHGIRKTPGISSVEVDGGVHEFLTGDKSHPRARDIYSKIEEMNTKLQEYGHRPRLGEVMFDVEAEEKGEALSYHSERLAIAFALTAITDRRTPVRIIKNLRVCVDCHSATKLISVIYGREIIVRDRNRFHHFKDGTCSCLDYW